MLNRISSHWILFFGVLCASSGAIFAKLAQNEGTPSLVVAAYRLSLSVIILLPILFSRYNDNFRNIAVKDIGKCFLGGLFLAIHFATWISSLEYTSIASSVVIVTTNPIWVALFTIIFQRVRPGKLLIIGLVIALAGGAVVGISEGCEFSQGALKCAGETQLRNTSLGNILALIGAWMAAGYLLVGKNIRQRMPLLPYISLVYGFAAIILVVYQLVFGNGLAIPNSKAFIWLVSLAIFPQLLGHSSLNWVLKKLSATYVSIALLAEPIGSTLMGILLFNEIPSWIKVFGAFLILGGILLVSLNENKKQVQLTGS